MGRHILGFSSELLKETKRLVPRHRIQGDERQLLKRAEVASLPGLFLV